MPKGSLVLLLLPALMWTFSLRQPSFSFLLLVVAYFLGHYEWLSNGDMDAYFAVYSGLSLVFAGRYISSWRDRDLLSALGALALVMALKNEGLLFGLCFAAGACCALKTHAGFRWSQLRRRLLDTKGLLAGGLVFLGPIATWNVYRFTWGLQNELTKSPTEAFTRILTRLVDGTSLAYILRYLLIDANDLWAPAVIFVAVLITTRLFLRRPIHPGATASLIAALLYFGGMVVVYLSTPATLNYHLTTSAARTMATTRIVVLIGIYFLLVDLEQPVYSRTPTSE
jgi:hypothetical protein